MYRPGRIGFDQHVQISSSAEGRPFACEIHRSNGAIVFNVTHDLAKRMTHFAG
jgi:hypothetical protein